MIATDLAPLTDWKALGARIGVTWKGREFTEACPVLSSCVLRAHADAPARPLSDLLLAARQYQDHDAEQSEKARYYAALPRRGAVYQPQPESCLETVVWTVRHSRGNHHAFHLDLTASWWKRDDGCIVPRLRDGLGRNVAATIMVCPADTLPAHAVRRLVKAERQRAHLAGGRTQLWEPCEICRREPSYVDGVGRHLCADHLPR